MKGGVFLVALKATGLITKRNCFWKTSFCTFAKSERNAHLRKVCGKELEDEGEGGLGVDDVVQSHNVGVAQLLQQARLSRGDHNEEGGEEGEEA